MRALSIRQPWAELILRGVKTVEYRSRPTRVIGERFLIYASRQWATGAGSLGQGSGPAAAAVWSTDLAVPDAPVPPWLIELAEGMRLWRPGELPAGLIVGSAVIDRVTRDPDARGLYSWHLADVERLAEPRKPMGRPQPVWFLEGSR